MGSMVEISRNEFTAAALRAVDDQGQLDPSALRAELLIEGNRQLGAVHAKGLVDDLAGMGLEGDDLQAVISELKQRLDAPDASRVAQALDDANLGEGWLERAGEGITDSAKAVGRDMAQGLSRADSQASDGMASARRHLGGIAADPNSSALARSAASMAGNAVQNAQAGYGFAKGVGAQALSTLGGMVDLGKMAQQMASDANYRDAVIGMVRSYAAQAAADPSKPIDDAAKAGKQALADWQAGLAQAKAQGREAEYLGRSGGAVALEVAATLIPISKLGKLGAVAKLLDKITPDKLAALGREIGDLSRMALNATGEAASGAAQALKGIVGLARGKGELPALITAARASGNLDGLLKSGALQPRELTALLKTSPEVFAGKVGFNDALAAATQGVDVAKLSAHEVGAIGEALVTRDLVKQGYTDIVAIQNQSGHGIDLIARSKAGELEFFEIKASATGNAKAPVAGSKNFIEDRLKKAIRAEGHWAEKNAPEGLKQHARDILDELDGSTPNARWIQVNLMTDKATGLLDIAATRPVASTWPQ